MPERITVIGLPDQGRDTLARAARNALQSAALVVGAQRHLEVAPPGTRTHVLNGELGGVLDAIAAEHADVCVLASGDPGFFGIVRPLAARFGSHLLHVLPAPSSVSLAFARLGIPWDDALVVSAHGRPLEHAVALASSADKAAVLVSPDNPPERLGAALSAAGAHHTRVVVCSQLGSDDEVVTETDLAGLAEGTWDPLSVVLLLADESIAARPSMTWGLPEERFEHRAGMITKSEVRAVALSKLDLMRRGVLWDIGAGSGSVAIEAARLAPGLAVYAVEARPDDAARIRRNAVEHGVTVQVIEGAAPDALLGLPDPDRIFLGGGGLEVLDVAIGRLGPKGRIVATYASLGRAVAAFEQLGDIVQVAVSRGESLPDGGVRLAAENPVFVVWGPDA
ncbi:MAG: precorrin-6y C5,15-methyltransferase (decarboxylating) subunit CbiE [Acidimicrobiales bacterium]